MKKKILFFLIVVITGIIILTVFFHIRNKYKDLCGYTEKLLKIEWNGCIEQAGGDAYKSDGEEHAHVKLEVKSGCEKEALGILQNRFGRSFDPDDSWPGYGGHPFAAEIDNGDTQYVFMTLMKGNRASTRTIIIYVVYDETGKMLIYVMG